MNIQKIWRRFKETFSPESTKTTMNVETKEDLENVQPPTPIGTTPFHTVKTKMGYMIVLGKWAVSTKLFRCKQDADDYLQKMIDWDLLLKAIAIYVDHALTTQNKNKNNN